MVALAATAVTLGIYATGALHALERQTIDARFGVRGHRRPRQPIIIVGIDQRTLMDLQMAPGALPRSIHAQLIDRLHRDGARLIGYDIQFVGEQDPREDRALTTAIARARPVLLATHDTPDGAVRVPAGRSAAQLGAVTGSVGVPTDSDGVIRHMLYAPVALKSFDVQAAQLVLGRPVSPQHFPHNTAWIDYAGPPGTFRTISFSDAVAGHVPAAAFRHKLVLVGYTDPAFQDIAQTPASSTPMPGVEIHANALETILDGFPLGGTSGVVNVLLIVLLSMLPAVLALRLPSLLVLGLGLVIAFVFLVAVQLAFNSGTIVAVVAPLFGLTLGTGGAIATEAFVERRQRKRLEDALGRLLPKPTAFFISYRRSDTRWPANSLKLQLSERFGEASVFMDTATIHPGQEWPSRIEQAIRGASVVLVLIGPRWLVAEPSGGRRIDDPDDWVRLEIEAALRRADIAVVPVLLEGAKMPLEDELPESLRALTRRNAIVLTAERYTAELDEFVDAIQRGVIQDYASRQASAPVLVHADGTDGSRRLLVNSELTIGTEHDCDLRLTDSDVAGHHARVWPVLDGLMVEDLGSGPGTWVDGQRIDGPQLVDRDTTLALGAATVQVVLGAGRRRGEELAALP